MLTQSKLKKFSTPLNENIPPKDSILDLRDVLAGLKDSIDQLTMMSSSQRENLHFCSKESKS